MKDFFSNRYTAACFPPSPRVKMLKSVGVLEGLNRGPRIPRGPGVARRYTPPQTYGAHCESLCVGYRPCANPCAAHPNPSAFTRAV